MALVARLKQPLDDALTSIAAIEKVSKQSLIIEAAEALVQQRIGDPEFQKKLNEYLKPLTDLAKTLET